MGRSRLRVTPRTSASEWAGSLEIKTKLGDFNLTAVTGYRNRDGQIIKLLDEVGSPAVKIYYHLAHAIEHQRDYVAELKKLGKDRVCQIHFSNTDGYWLKDDPAVNAPKVKAALDEMNWSGWLVIERSRNTNDVHNRLKNYGTNAAYLKSVFQ